MLIRGSQSERKSMGGCLGPGSRNTLSWVVWGPLFPLFTAVQAYDAIVPNMDLIAASLVTFFVDILT